MEPLTENASANRPLLDRGRYLSDFRAARQRTETLFTIPAADAYYTRPIALRNPLVFYEGHIPAFAINVLLKLALSKPGVDDRLETLFARGIDPEDEASVPSGSGAWPSRDEVRAYVSRADALLLDAITNCDLQRSDTCWENNEALHTIYEHELMHQETLLYMLHQLPHELKVRRDPLARSHASAPAEPPTATATIARGEAILGRPRDAFGWDNEHDQHVVTVEAFEIDVHNVTNGRFIEFVDAGGYEEPSLWTAEAWEWRKSHAITHPHFWNAASDGAWQRRGFFGDEPLPLDAPVYVTQAEAEAYARWKGKRLPTEAEFHRAAFSTPDGRQRYFPWGDDPPRLEHGNFGFQNWDAVAVGSYPAGASAWGVHDLVGNGWEWTSTIFAPFDGFRPMATYKEYSADFFDGRHYVIKGASPVTPLPLIRRSFRNWFRATYPYVYATFRCVSGADVNLSGPRA